jgi:hypothetical protein
MLATGKAVAKQGKGQSHSLWPAQSQRNGDTPGAATTLRSVAGCVEPRAQKYLQNASLQIKIKMIHSVYIRAHPAKQMRGGTTGTNQGGPFRLSRI